MSGFFGIISLFKKVTKYKMIIRQREEKWMEYMLYGGGGFEILFFAAFIIIIGIFIVVFMQGIGQWNENNHSPRLDVEATIISKRTDMSRHYNGGDITGAHGVHTHTSYFITFQVESGDRMEFSVSEREYGQLIEGDYGKLSFQGTRFLGFERKN